MFPGLPKKACPCLLSSRDLDLFSKSPLPHLPKQWVVSLWGPAEEEEVDPGCPEVRDGRCELGVADSYPFVGLGFGVDT